MARPVSAYEAKKLRDKSKKYLSDMKAALSEGEQNTRRIMEAASALVGEQSRSLLGSIAVEELNRDKKGIRVKALRDAGFTTLGDVERASLSRLAAINGISEEGARTIKLRVKEIYKTTASTGKLKLSSDAKSPAATKLIKEIYIHRASVSPLMDCAIAREEHGSKAEKALLAINPATGGLKWTFASKANRAAALEAFNYLKSLDEGGQFKTLSKALEQLKMLSRVTERQLWEDFGKNSIEYYTVLEGLCPDMVGSDSLYGLPGELAEAIGAVELKLEGLRCTLRRYQEWGVKYAIHRKRALLGDEMGLGKTVQAIAAMVHLKNEGSSHFVVVCPASVLTNWCREIEKHSDLKVVKIHGGDREEAFARWLREGGVAVTTYETTEHIKTEDSFSCAMTVVDEAHYVKNPEARRSINTRRICRASECVLFMTGTALENRVDEMLELIGVLDSNLAAEARSMAFMSSALQFREKIASVYYRRRRDDVLTELPELIENMDWCALSGEEARLYEEAVMSDNFAAARRVSWNVDDLSLSSKAKRLGEIIEDAEEDGRKIIVFSYFLSTIAKITEYFGSRCMPPITGSIAPAQRQAIIDEFEKAPAGSLLIAQIQAGGTGLNIQTASVVVICEPQFKPSIENQAISRAYRMGQTRNVLVHRLLCDDTVDERIVQLLADKQEAFDAFADESAVGRESLELDMRGFGNILEEEKARITAKNKI